jgi:hypothetical protein
MKWITFAEAVKKVEAADSDYALTFYRPHYETAHKGVLEGNAMALYLKFGGSSANKDVDMEDKSNCLALLNTAAAGAIDWLWLASLVPKRIAAFWEPLDEIELKEREFYVDLLLKDRTITTRERLESVARGYIEDMYYVAAPDYGDSDSSDENR